MDPPSVVDQVTLFVLGLFWLGLAAFLLAVVVDVVLSSPEDREVGLRPSVRLALVAAFVVMPWLGVFGLPVLVLDALGRLLGPVVGAPCKPAGSDA